MRRYLVLVGLLCGAVLLGCEAKDTKAPGGPTAPEVKQEEGVKAPAVAPVAPEPKKAAADMPADPFAGPPALEIPKIEPPKIEPPKKADAK